MKNLLTTWFPSLDLDSNPHGSHVAWLHEIKTKQSWNCSNPDFKNPFPTLRTALSDREMLTLNLTLLQSTGSRPLSYCILLRKKLYWTKERSNLIKRKQNKNNFDWAQFQPNIFAERTSFIGFNFQQHLVFGYGKKQLKNEWAHPSLPSNQLVIKNTIFFSFQILPKETKNTKNKVKEG